MANNSSSAEPQELIRYADRGNAISYALRGRASPLRGALSRFQATCTEPAFRQHVTGSEAGLADLANRALNLDDWVLAVGLAFQRADRQAAVAVMVRRVIDRDMSSLPVYWGTLGMVMALAKRLLDIYGPGTDDGMGGVSGAGVNLLEIFGPGGIGLYAGGPSAMHADEMPVYGPGASGTADDVDVLDKHLIEWRLPGASVSIGSLSYLITMLMGTSSPLPSDWWSGGLGRVTVITDDPEDQETTLPLPYGFPPVTVKMPSPPDADESPAVLRVDLESWHDLVALLELVHFIPEAMVHVVSQHGAEVWPIVGIVVTFIVNIERFTSGEVDFDTMLANTAVDLTAQALILFISIHCGPLAIPVHIGLVFLYKQFVQEGAQEWFDQAMDDFVDAVWEAPGNIQEAVADWSSDVSEGFQGLGDFLSSLLPSVTRPSPPPQSLEEWYQRLFGKLAWSW